MPSILQRFKKAWNVFTSRSPTTENPTTLFSSSGGLAYRPDRVRLHYTNERTTISAIYNQISIDCMNMDIKHALMDKDGMYRGDVDGTLNDCLTLSANLDQTGKAFIQDMVLSLLDEGCIAVIPVDVDIHRDRINILSLRTAKILQWFPDSIKCLCYNERTGKKEEVVVPKQNAAIIENPLYSVMNEPNSTLRRLSRKLALLDQIDENDYGKLDLIIQLPYVIKSDARRDQAEKRRKDIENQLAGSKYGIAYTDGTEHITQLNRSLDNHLLDQINQLKEELYSQLGLTKEVFSGTADEQTMLNYYNRTVEPIMTAITDEMTRKFLTKNARTRGQKIVYFRNPFKLVPVNSIADIADKFTRNAILSSNEIRTIVGFKAVNTEDADALRNKNLNTSDNQEIMGQEGQDPYAMMQGEDGEIPEDSEQYDDQGQYDEEQPEDSEQYEEDSNQYNADDDGNYERYLNPDNDEDGYVLIDKDGNVVENEDDESEDEEENKKKKK